MRQRISGLRLSVPVPVQGASRGDQIPGGGSKPGLPSDGEAGFNSSGMCRAVCSSARLHGVAGSQSAVHVVAQAEAERQVPKCHRVLCEGGELSNISSA